MSRASDKKALPEKALAMLRKRLRRPSSRSKSYYLVCKAGAGLAGQTFHARLSAALKSGSTLDEALSDDGTPGAKALRRVAVAAKRNRCRILNIAAQSLGFVCVDTIGDNASPLSSP